MRRGSRAGGLPGLPVFALCALFAFLALGSALLGSGVYRSCVRQGEENSARRTVLSYLVNQVRQGDNGSIGVTTFGGGDALVLTSAADGVLYDTVIYCFDGSLRELYCERGLGLLAQDGTALTALDGLEIGLEGGRLRFDARLGESRFSVSAAPRAGAARWDGAYEEVLP